MVFSVLLMVVEWGVRVLVIFVLCWWRRLIVFWKVVL